MTELEAGVLATSEREYWINLAKSLESLEKNPDFKTLILEGYLKDKALYSVSLLGDTSTKKRGERPNVMEDLIAISNLGYYLMMVKDMGGSAKADKEEEEELR